MADFYGVRTKEQATSVNVPVIATSGVVIAFGTAPVHQVDGEANTIVVAHNYEEAIGALGYSDDWEKYTLCEVMHSHFRLYGMAPLLLVNVLDPDKHKTEVQSASYPIVDGKVELTGDAIASSIKVTGSGSELTAGVDYDTFYDDGKCYVEALTGGAIDTAHLSAVTIEFSKVSFELSELVDDVIGGYEVSTGKSTGLELVDMAYFKEAILPDIIIAPGFSHNSTVAAVMATKTSFSTVFRGICICDMDTASVTSYQAAAEAKTASGSFKNAKQIVCWPMVALSDRKFHLSTQLAGCMCKVDAGNDGVPSKVASNQPLQAGSAVLEDGTEILLDITQANFLRNQGIVTAYNFVNGFTVWGALTACATSSVDPKDRFINISRMFNYVANTIVLTFWRRIDENLTPRFSESIIDELNMWLNSLVSTENLLGARCEIRAEENPRDDLTDGIVRVHIYMTPPSPTQEIDAILEYDVDYVSAVIGGTGEE